MTRRATTGEPGPRHPGPGQGAPRARPGRSVPKLSIVGDNASPPPPAREFLITMTTRVPVGTPPGAVDDIRAREAAPPRALAAQGHVLRLWRPPLAPGEWRTLGLFAAAGAAERERVLASMPLRVWRRDEVEELTSHPNDPAPMPSSPRFPQTP